MRGRMTEPKSDRIIDVINWGRALFIERNVPHARYTIEVLLEHVLGRKRADLYCDYDSRLSAAEMGRLRKYVGERLARKPLWHLVGAVEFYGLTMRVNDRVLIPRPETELLVERALKELEGLPRAGVRYVADIGTGSGNIAIAIARSTRGVFVYATDLSPEALAVAEANARENGVEGEISLLSGDLLAPFRAGGRGRIDMIVSNPPYVSDADWADLPPEVREREPRLALHGGMDGLECIARLVDGAPSVLVPGGTLLLEVGSGQAPRVGEMMTRAGAYGRIEVHRDYAGIERVVVGAVKN
jgi:release factor glutamine methyltransferase